MNHAVAIAREKLSAAIRTFHKDITTIYPIGLRVRMTKGNRVRLGTVHFQ